MMNGLKDVPTGQSWVTAIRLHQEVLLFIAGILAIVAVMLFHLQTLTIAPTVDGDESWFSNAAWNWVETGVVFDTMHSGPLDQFGREWVRRQFIGMQPWAWSFAVAGVGLFQARLPSLLLGGLLLALTVLVSRHSYSLLTGVLAALLLAISQPFFQASHFARQEIFLAAILMLVYFLVQKAHENELWWGHLLAGMLVGFSIDIHQNGWLFAPAFGGVYLAVYGKQILSRRGTWLAALGGVIGAVYFVGIFVLPDPDTYFNLQSFAFASGHQGFPGVYGVVDAIRGEISRYDFFNESLQFALIGTSFLVLVVRRNASDKRLLVFVAIAFLIFTFFRGSKTPKYAILAYPFMMIMVAETIISVLRNNLQLVYRAFGVGLLGMVLLSGGLGLAQSVKDQVGYDYHSITRQIRAVIPDDARVMGLPIWWLGLSDVDYRSSLSLNYYHYFNDFDLQQGLDAIHPDYIILDGISRGLLEANKISLTPYWGLPGQEFYGFLERQGNLVLDFPDEWHGHIEVYKIEWES